MPETWKPTSKNRNQLILVGSSKTHSCIQKSKLFGVEKLNKANKKHDNYFSNKCLNTVNYLLIKRTMYNKRIICPHSSKNINCMMRLSHNVVLKDQCIIRYDLIPKMNKRPLNQVMISNNLKIFM